MKKYEKVMLTINTIIIIVFTIGIIYFRYHKVDKPTEITKNLTVLSDPQEFFEVNLNVNKYYEFLSTEKSKVSYIINEKYKDKISDLFEKQYGTTTFFSKNISYFKTDQIYYYLISGDLINNDSKINMDENIKLFMIVDNKHKTFNIMPVENESLTDFFDKYKIDYSYKIDVNDNNLYTKRRFINEDYAVTYVSYFRYLLVLKTKEAYNNYLSPSYLLKFKNYDDFYNKRVDTANNIKLIMSTFEEKTRDGNTVYVMDYSDGSYIVLTISGIMNFKIDIG